MEIAQGVFNSILATLEETLKHHTFSIDTRMLL